MTAAAGGPDLDGVQAAAAHLSPGARLCDDGAADYLLELLELDGSPAARARLDSAARAMLRALQVEMGRGTVWAVSERRRAC